MGSASLAAARQAARLSQDGDPSHPYIVFVAEPGLMERKWTLRT